MGLNTIARSTPSLSEGTAVFVLLFALWLLYFYFPFFIWVVLFTDCDLFPPSRISSINIYRSGTKNPAVLPDPVGAIAITSLPVRTIGIAYFWIGVGCSYSRSLLIERNNAGHIPRSENEEDESTGSSVMSYLDRVVSLFIYPSS